VTRWLVGRWIALVVMTSMLAIASRGQYLVAEGRPAFFFPPATGLYQFPFRQARELTVDGMPRTEVGCVDESGAFVWRAFDEHVLTQMPGPHHRKVAWNQVLSNSMGSPTKALVKKTVVHVACVEPALRALLSCSGRATVGIRNRTIAGAVSRQWTWVCP
jgi:hypothetical protein